MWRRRDGVIDTVVVSGLSAWGGSSIFARNGSAATSHPLGDTQAREGYRQPTKQARANAMDNGNAGRDEMDYGTPVWMQYGS